MRRLLWLVLVVLILGFSREFSHMRRSAGIFDKVCRCTESLSLHVTVLDDSVFRFHFLVGAVAQADRKWLYSLASFTGPQALKVEDDGDILVLETQTHIAEIDSESCSVTVLDREETPLWQSATPLKLTAEGRLFLGLKLREGERIFGLGEKTGALDRRGRRYEMWNRDAVAYGVNDDPLYQSHPFYLSLADGRAIGSFLANTRRSYFDVGKAENDVLGISVDGGDMDLFFFGGPTPGRVLEQYTRLTGRAPLPPKWTLGYHQCRWSYPSAKRVREIAKGFRDRKMPADGLWLDIDYMRGFRDFTWNYDRFPDPKGLMSELEAQGFKTTAIIDPGIKHDPGGQYSAYDEGVIGKHFIKYPDGSDVIREVWPGKSVFPDFSARSTREWWGALIGRFLEYGLRGIWVDMNEIATFDKEFPMEAVFDGEGVPTDYREIKNIYGSLMARATYEGMLAKFPNRRPFVLTRAAFSGISRFAAVWLGDTKSAWDRLRLMPTMFQGMSLSGVSFIGSDVGGFIPGAVSPEMYARWFELGAFSPFFRSHVASGMPDQEPWSFGAEVEADAKRLLELRYRMLPYWYTVFDEFGRSGMPIIRPLWFDHPSDLESFRHEDEFFVGAALLVAPVLSTKALERRVYLPQGLFYDFFTGVAHSGPVTLRVPAPQGSVPLFVKAGSVIPQGATIQFVGDPSESTDLFLDVFPSAAGTAVSSEIYEDDGETLNYKKGDFSRLPVVVATTGKQVSVEVGKRRGKFQPRHRQLVIRIHGVETSPSTVTVDGASVAGGYSSDKRILSAAIKDDGGAHRVIANYGALRWARPRKVALRFKVELPEGTPDGDVYLASSAREWVPDGLKLKRVGAVATGTLKVNEGQLVKVRVTRGTWESAAEDPLASTIADWGLSGTKSVNLRVHSWSDF